MGIKKIPFAYEHPAKRKAVTPVTKPLKSAIGVTKENPNKEKEEESSKPQSKLKTVVSSNRSSSATLLRLVVRPPKSGLFPLYDEMIASGLSPKEAILGLLKRGYSQFEIDISANVFEKSNKNYEADGDVIETTRSVDEAFLTSCRDVFDKFGVLSNRALGQKIGEAIFSRTAMEK